MESSSDDAIWIATLGIGMIVQGDEKTKPVNDRALSNRTFWILLLVHCLAGLCLFMLLVYAQRFNELLAALKDRGKLPLLTAFVLFFSRHLLWLLGIGFSLDAIVLYAVGQLSKKSRWLVITWFSLVLLVLGVLCVLTVTGILLPVVEMSHII